MLGLTTVPSLLSIKKWLKKPKKRSIIITTMTCPLNFASTGQLNLGWTAICIILFPEDEVAMLQKVYLALLIK